jgi:hypothetical protein
LAFGRRDRQLELRAISIGMRVFVGFLFLYAWLLQHAALVHLSASSWLTSDLLISPGDFRWAMKTE